ncbi:undecaprenyl diphosphate synthase [marine gamma proteobacterium HTCC2080]|jgi:undecaprenyl diphosphate synthase|nr:undecaprenyl diphosphate synthase [marine gamma proteobacterium HTCC2080]
MNKPFESNLIKWRPEPRHIAIIMDGNGRWASRRGLPVPAGHRAGVEAVRSALKGCKDKGIEVLTLFAFSSENWGRPETEVRALMALLCHYLRREVEQLQRDSVRLRFIGRRDRLSLRLQRLMIRSEEATAANTGATLVLAVDYGGQWDVIDAVRKLASEVAAGTLSADEINSDRFEQTLSLGDLPPPDLCIRTGGDARISNFMLWQLAYTEFYFCEALWPDFDEAALTRAIEDFQSRERRFGLRSGSDIFSESLDKTWSP